MCGGSLKPCSAAIRRVAEALDSDRGAVEARRAERALNKRVEKAMRSAPLDERELDARLAAVGVT